MKKIRSLLKKISFRVSLLMILSMLIVLTVSGLLIHKLTLNSQFNSLRNSLMIITQIAALDIDAQTLKNVPLNRDGVHSQEYKTIAEKLNKIKAVDSQIKYIYTLAKTDTDGMWQFIVDPNPRSEKQNEPTAFPGDRYDATRFPEMQKAFNGPTADRKLEQDEWGVTLSGYAPIKDNTGTPIAILGIDIAANNVYLIQQEVHHRTIIMLCLGILISILIGSLVSQRITNPILKLLEATRQIGGGNLQHQVKVYGDDEIKELADSFNTMAVNLHQSRKRILGYIFNVVKTLVRILELRDHYTRGHSVAVAIYAGEVAAKMGFPKDTIKLFKRMTLLHDIGKLGINDNILHKKGALTDEEWAIMRKHPLVGEEILKPVLGDEEMLAIVRGHHERYDGKGYPDQLSRERINIFAAIVSVVDAYHAMTSNRSYRLAMTKEAAIDELKKHSGTQFHPKVVEVFLQVLKEESPRFKKFQGSAD